MTKLLTTISGQFTKAFVFAALLPAVVFVILNIVLIFPLFPSGLSPVERLLKDFDAQWQAFIAFFVAIVVSGVLYNLNIPLIRFYEGYPFAASWLGRRMRDRQVRKLARMDEEIERLRDKYENMSPDDDEYLEVEAKLIRLWSGRQVQFPPKGFVTPTELGNVIAAFEHYARLQYGMDSVVLWPRLVAGIDAAYAGIIDDAKTSFDFFINLSFVLALLVLEYLCVGLYFRTHLSSLPDTFAFLGIVALLGLLSWLLYRASIDSAVGWGHHVKAAFDLYRWALLDKLGYKFEPAVAQEVDLWQEISQAMLYGRPDSAPPRYTKPVLGATRVDAKPSDIEWTWNITKAVAAATPPRKQPTVPTVIKYVLTAKNTTDEKADSATLVDTVPLGFDLLAGSSQLHKNGHSAEVEPVGTNPYSWELGAVDAGQSATITYLVLLRPAVGEASS